MIARPLALALAASLLSPAHVHATAPHATQAQSEAPGAQAPDARRVYLLTFGPGAQVWERFGHNALWIHDPAAGTDVAYHYGLFDMSEAGFLAEFLKGRMEYLMGAADAHLLVDAYRRAGRSTTVQELGLDREQAEDLQAFLSWNMRPDNRVYRYDYFRDNCSTRIRDALDDALGGALSAALRARDTPITYRDESVALTAEDELLATGLDFVLGPMADASLTRWDLAFIPMRLRDDVGELTIERDGRRLPLVLTERVLPAVGAPDETPAVPTGLVDGRVVWMLLVGVLAGGFLTTLGWLSRQRADAGPVRRVARWTLAIAGAFWGLLTGVLGVTLLALWLFTDHEFAHANENLLQANPLALALVVLVPLAVARRGSNAAFYVAAALAGLSALGLLVLPLPLTPQATLGIIALALPVHFGLLYAVASQGVRSGSAARPRRP